MDENKSILRDQTLLTGSSGFLGSIINRCSEDKLLTLGRSYKDILKTNLTEEIPILPNNVSKVIHCMGLAHFEPKTNQESNYFFKVNYDATVNLTKAIDEHCENLKQFIFISSVSVYGQNSQKTLISKNDETLPDTPYGESKLCAENFLKNWANDKNISLLILRLPLVIGKNSKGNLGKMIKYLEKGLFFLINKGKAKKSMVLAEDIARLVLSSSINRGTYILTDNYHPSFFELTNFITKQLKLKKPKMISNLIAFPLAIVGSFLPMSPINLRIFNNLNKTLIFSDDEAAEKINWNPNKVLSDASWLEK